MNMEKKKVYASLMVVWKEIGQVMFLVNRKYYIADEERNYLRKIQNWKTNIKIV